MGFYRDNCLAVVKKTNGPKLDKLRKEINVIFKAENHVITIEINPIETDLDVTFKLHTGKSNHPGTIKKDLLRMIDKRNSELSCSKEEFDKAKRIYEETLNESDIKVTLKFVEQQTERTNRNRIFFRFNPLYNEYIKINIDRQFLKLIREHFRKHHKFSKVSYVYWF